MFETSLAKDENHELKKVILPEGFTITQIKIKYEEYPDRNTFIHGLELTGKNKQNHTESIFNETFAHYRGREEKFHLAEG